MRTIVLWLGTFRVISKSYRFYNEDAKSKNKIFYVLGIEI